MPRVLSFNGALHTVRSFEEVHWYDPKWIEAESLRLPGLIAKRRVGDRPDRDEPRAVERRPLLMMPWTEAKGPISCGKFPYSKSQEQESRN